MARVKLTQKYIDNPPPVPPQKAKMEHCDIALPGLLWEQRAINPEWGTFRLRYKLHGKTSSVTVGRSCDIALQEAREKTKKLKAEIQLGADPQAAVRERRKILTWSQYMETIYFPHARAHLRSYKNLESLNEKYLGPLANQPINTISLQVAQKLHRDMVNVHGLSPASADHLAKLMRQALLYACRLDIIDSTPVSKIRLFNVQNTEERLLSDHQLQCLMQVLDTDKNRTVCLVVKFLLFTGARVNEALHARWADINRQQRTWTIEATNSKSKQRRSAPLSGAALSVLDQLPSEGKSEWLFTSSRGGGRLTEIGKVWTRLRRQAGLEGSLDGGRSFRLHDARHAAASAMVSSGQSLYTVQKILGHSDPSVTQRYAHLSTEALQDAANSIGDYIEKALEKKK